MKRTVVTLLVLLGLLLVGWIAYQSGALSGWLDTSGPGDQGAATPKAGADDAADPGRGVVALGRVEPAGGTIDVAALVGDRLETLLVKEGEVVAKGKTLALLESRSLREPELRAVESQLEEARARAAAETKLADARIVAAGLAVKKAETMDLDIEAQRKKVDLARASLKLARKDLARLEGLRKESPRLVSDQENERQRLVVDRAEAELSAAEAMLKKLHRSRDLAVEAARADLDAARATRDQVLASIPVKSLQRQRDLAQKQYEKTEIAAPCDGTVLKVFMRPGETIAHRPILQMADLTKMVVLAEVYETDVKRVRVGQRAVVKSKAFGRPHDDRGVGGTVERIARTITTPELKSLDPLASADRRVVEVRIRLDGEGSEQAAGLVNLQVDVTILAGDAAGRPSDPPQKP